MANYNLKTRNSIPLLLSISFFLLLILNKVNSLGSAHFCNPKFVPDQQNLLFQLHAHVTPTGVLQLTRENDGVPASNSIGRALYSAPIHIWDKTTGEVAGFETSFSFIIKAPNEAKMADGLAFFLAPVDTQPLAAGGLLGLFKDRFYNKSNQIVAVEFDTLSNVNWDPKGIHMGINVNSIESVKTVPWDLANGHVANVVIDYQATTKSLTASLVYPSLEKSFIVNAIVDVKDVLPEWVRVGLTATTGLTAGYAQTHDVLSWDFETFPRGHTVALRKNSFRSTYAA